MDYCYPTEQENGHRGRICTCDHLVPGQACCCYTTRCFAPRDFRKALGGLVLVGTEVQRPCRGTSLEIWRFRRDLHPQSSRRQRVAFLFSYGSLRKWWEVLVMLQFVASGFI